MENESNDPSTEQQTFNNVNSTEHYNYPDDFHPEPDEEAQPYDDRVKVSDETTVREPVDDETAVKGSVDDETAVKGLVSEEATRPEAQMDNWFQGPNTGEDGSELSTNPQRDPVTDIAATTSSQTQITEDENEDIVSTDLIKAEIKDKEIKCEEGEAATFTVTVHNIYNDDVRITWYRQSQLKRPLQDGDIYKITTTQSFGKVIGELKIMRVIKNEEGDIHAKIRKQNEPPIVRTANLTVTEQKPDHWDIYQNEKEKWNAVDYKPENKCINRFMKGIRFITQKFLLISLLLSIIISKSSFQVLVNQLGLEERRKTDAPNEETVTRTVILWLLCITLTTPDILSAINWLIRWLFGKKHHRGDKLPSERIFKCTTKTSNKRHTNGQNNENERHTDGHSNGRIDANSTCDTMMISVLYIAREVAHCIGIYGIVFRVLPFLDPIESCVFTPSLLFFASVMNMVNKCPKRKFNRNCLESFIFLFQLGPSALLFYVISVRYNEKNLHWDFIVWIVISHFCVPMRWLPTYLKADTCKYPHSDTGCYKTFIKWINGDMKTEYSLTKCVAAIARYFVILFIFFPSYYSKEYKLLIWSFKEFVSFNTNDTNILNSTITYRSGCTGGVFENFLLENTEDMQWQYLITGPFLAHIIGTILSYHFAVLACRLRMKRAAYSVPLSVATPIYVIVVFTLSFTDISYFGCYENDFMQGWLFGAFVFAWILQLWLCRRALIEPQPKVMPFKESLFHTPHYCSPIADLSILHSYIGMEKGKERHQSNTGEKGNREDIEKGKANGNNSKQQTSDNVTSISAPNESVTAKSGPSDSDRMDKNSDHDTDHAMIYVCATMWHEEPNEMKCLILSLLRLDYDRAVHGITCGVKGYNPDPSDKFKFEGHIFFDDAFVNKEKEQSIHEGKRIKNRYVDNLIKSMEEALREFYNTNVKLKPPKEMNTLYGKQLTWTLPGRNNLVLHLKDKEKFRHMKRWSQVMYFYYLLGYKLLQDKCDTKTGNNDDQTVQMTRESDRQKVENTFILALDGDVKFYPIALKRLLERMKKNPQVAATSGRIIPCGSGPVVWYQRFEYAVGHWLQKTTEHMFGCVLCSPGCFSLFRATAVLTGNIMRTYASQSTKPRHYIQYDQGEDRWLCTLLLKEGFRVEYCAASEAKTFVPEEFGVLFTQRKRWIPSTLANIFDVILNSKQIRKKNPSISIFYIAYQFLLLLSTVLGPSTILLAMDAAIRVVFDLQIWVVYLLVYGPVAFYILVCLKLSLNVQRQIGLVLSLAYALLMLSVLIGTIVSIIQEGWYTPSATFLYILFGTFVVAGLLHIHELFELVFVFLYFILLPLGFLYIMIYAVCNLNDVSWGTRENEDDKKRNQNTQEETQESYLKRFRDARHQVSTEFRKEILQRDEACSSKTQTLLYIFKCSYYILQLKLFEILCEEKDSTNQKKLIKRESGLISGGFENPSNTVEFSGSGSFFKKDIPTVPGASEVNTNVTSGETDQSEKETLFWRKLKERYLDPIDKNEQAVNELKSYRNKVASMFFFLNGIWIVIVSSMNEVKQDLNITINFSNGKPVVIEPFGFTFLTIFTLLLFVQTIGMFFHRYSTFLHVVAATDMRSDQTHDNLKIKKYAEKLLCPKIQKPEQKTEKGNGNDNSGQSNEASNCKTSTTPTTEQLDNARIFQNKVAPSPVKRNGESDENAGQDKNNGNSQNNVTVNSQNNANVHSQNNDNSQNNGNAISQNNGQNNENVSSQNNENSQNNDKVNCQNNGHSQNNDNSQNNNKNNYNASSQNSINNLERKQKMTVADLKSASKKASDENIKFDYLDLQDLYDSRMKN